MKMEEKKVMAALLELGCTKRKAKKLICDEREKRKKAQEKRDVERTQKLFNGLLGNLY